VQNLGAQGLPEQGAWAVIDRTMTVQSATSSATDIFWISSVLFLSLIVLLWMTKPAKSSAPIDAGGAH